MCGRFENTLSLASLVQALRESHPELKFDFSDEELNKKNIAPTNSIAALIYSGDTFKLKTMGWGIKFSAGSPLIFNSRLETILEKPYWKNLLKSSRCVVPMTGFYEWKKEGTRKIPYRIYLPGQNIFFVPGLFLEMKGDTAASLKKKDQKQDEELFPLETEPEKGAAKGTGAVKPFVYVSLITTTPNKFIEKIHHRMPVILNENEALEFLCAGDDRYMELLNPLNDSVKMEMEETAIQAI